MARKAEARSVPARFLGVDPLDGEQLLLEALFGPNLGGAESSSGHRELAVVPAPTAPAPAPAPRQMAEQSDAPVVDSAAAPPEPSDDVSGGEAPDRADRHSAPAEHYKVVSISLYREDIELLERYVQELKRRGHYKANKSHIIRQALAQLDLDRVVTQR